MYDEPPPSRGQVPQPGREPEGAQPGYARDSVTRISPGAPQATYAPAGAATTTTTTEVVAAEPVGPAPALMVTLGLLAGLLIGLAIAYAIFHSATG